MDLKKAVEDIKKSPTLKFALGSLLAIGNFLNGNQVYISIAPSINILTLRVYSIKCLC